MSLAKCVLIRFDTASDEPNGKDGLVHVAAKMLEADAIITYDKKALRSSTIVKLTAGEALKSIAREDKEAI